MNSLSAYCVKLPPVATTAMDRCEGIGDPIGSLSALHPRTEPGTLFQNGR